MDLYLAPFPDGISTRRGSAIVALQHGVPLLSTRGRLSDTVFLAAEGTSLALAPATSAREFAAGALELYRDPERRARIGRGGRDLYDRVFSWECIAARMVKALSEYGMQDQGGGSLGHCAPARDSIVN